MGGHSQTYSNRLENGYFRTSLPAHWLAKKLGHLAANHQNAFVDGPFGSDLKSSEYKDSGIPLIQLNNIRDGLHVLRNMKFVSAKKSTELSRHIARPGDVVIAKMAEPVARSAMVSSEHSDYVIVADCVKMTPNEEIVDMRFLVWAINSDPVKVNAELASTGTTRIRINLGELKKLRVPFPPLPEQTQIAAFLDHETAKIDALIAKQERLIALLEEKRQAVISHAVTKGLNPDAPLRPSGIDWLGDVPAHWDVKKVSWGFKATKGKNGQLLTKEYCGQHSGPFPVYSGQTENQGVLGRISWYEFDFGSDGTLFATTVGAKAMHLSYLSGKLSLSQNCMLITPTDAELLTRFYYYHFQPLFKYERSLIPEHMQASFRMEDLYQYQHAVPPPTEQQAIAEYLDAKTEKFADLVSKAQSAITLLKERRTALISAAVTGKIDVRDWQPPKDISDQDTKQKAFA